jgi:exopolyphosphatase/guanosine-5'-triphosphate,3'-diphosphate pyrophosphatase
VRAVANSFAVEDAWVMDLGGGSAQISEMRARSWVAGRAYPLGALRLTEAHLASDPPRRAEVAALEAALAAELDEPALAMRGRPLPLVAMGGTIRNLTRAVQKRCGYPLGRVHGYFLKTADLAALTADLLALPLDKRRRIGGIHPDRADVILAGALVYRWLLTRAEREGLWISGYGVREGAFLERFLPPPHLHPDVRAFSVENLFQLYAQPRAHTANVRRLARRIFEGLAPLHQLPPAAAELLDAAAWLHDIGMTVGYHKHHKHGAYLVETTHLLNGFTHREQVLVMLLVRYHRRGSPSLGVWRELVEPGDKGLLLRLAACLRLAEYLERARAGQVRDVRVWIGPKTATLELLAREEPVVEMWEAMKHAALFEQAFGRRLILKRSPETHGAGT